MMTRRKATPPPGLAADLLRVGDDEWVVLSWDAPSPPAHDLTRAEQDVLARLVAGKSNAAIAAARRVSPRTVANQVASLLRKLGATSRFDLIRRFGGTPARAR